MAMLRVAIIGAGGAGLAMCRCLANEPKIEFVAFEKCDKIGGVWLYTKDKERSDHTSMYKNLRTNLPKEIMEFPEYPFCSKLPSFIDNKTVCQYLEDFAHHYMLMKYIRFEHEVMSVMPWKDKETQMWQIVTKDLKNGSLKEEIFNAVVVCNGHFQVPIFPKIPGMKDFPGTMTTVIHSIDYNIPEVFKDQTVLVLGAGSSGLDVCMEISKFAKKVYLVHRGYKIPSKAPENVDEIIGTLTCGFPDSSVEINHELRIHVDSVIYCTGYKYNFPFLTPECNIKVEDNRVISLYKHVFSTANPSLSFIGLCKRIIPFPQFDLQANWITSILSGRKVLPSCEEMMTDERLEFEERLSAGIALHKMHSMPGERLWNYHNELSALAGVALLSPVLHSLYDHAEKLRVEKLLTYRSINFRIKGNEWFEI